MKRIFLISAVAILLSSCTTIGFDTPVPKDTPSIKQFPKELIGTYYDGEKDTLKIFETGFVYGTKDSTMFFMNKNLEANLVELKKFNEYYILNIKSDNENIWGIMPFIYKNDKITIYFSNLDAKQESLKLDGDTIEIETIIQTLQKITPVRVVDKENSDDKEFFINPSNEELKMLFDEGYFIKIMEFNRIKQ